MIDYSNYNLAELQAMEQVLDDLTYRMSISETMKAHMLPYHYYKEVKGAVLIAIDQQAREHTAAEAEKVNRIKNACIAGAPPVEEPDEHSDLRALVNILSRCSDQLTALALVEDRHFEESSEMDAFIKSTVLRNANRSIIDIRDHYREVLNDD